MQEDVAEVEDQPQSEDAGGDLKADVRAILVMFSAAVLMAVHFVSGFTFDF